MQLSHILSNARTGWLVALVAVGCATFAWNTRAADGPAPERIFEMRTYTTLPGRLPALQKRFREHTVKLFEKHGMTNIGYWVPVDSPKSENTLVYILAHKSKEARDQSFKDFSADPAWKAARDASEADGKIVEKVDYFFMTATDYSAIK